MINEQQQGGRVKWRRRLALHVDQQPDQGHEYCDEVPAFLEYIPESRQFLSRQALQFVARRIGINLHEQSEEVQYRRYDCCHRNGDITDTEKAGHYECCCTHDGRHKHSAGRGAGFNARCVLTAETNTLHGRDR